jgi:hypothetical protein
LRLPFEGAHSEQKRRRQPRQGCAEEGPPAEAFGQRKGSPA